MASRILPMAGPLENLKRENISSRECSGSAECGFRLIIHLLSKKDTFSSSRLFYAHSTALKKMKTGPHKARVLGESR